MCIQWKLGWFHHWVAGWFIRLGAWHYWLGNSRNLAKIYLDEICSINMIHFSCLVILIPSVRCWRPCFEQSSQNCASTSASVDVKSKCLTLDSNCLMLGLYKSCFCESGKFCPKLLKKHKIGLHVSFLYHFPGHFVLGDFVKVMPVLGFGPALSWVMLAYNFYTVKQANLCILTIILLYLVLSPAV